MILQKVSVQKVPMRTALRLALAGLLLAPLAALPADTDKQPKWDVTAPDYSVAASQALLDVSEGTWMSLDVAPDGKHIVFDLLGDIYQIPFSGGQAEPLRAGLAWEIQPTYSPDGKSIAFTSDIKGGDNIWTLELATGDARQITH